MTSARSYRIALLSIHANPLGPLGTPDTGGMSVCIRELANQLATQGHWVEIFTGRAAPVDPGADNLHERVRLIQLDIGVGSRVPKGGLHRWVPAFARALDNSLAIATPAHDLVHSHYWLSGAVARKSRALRKRPHVISFHTTALAKMAQCREEQEPSYRIDGEQELIDHSDRILAASVREREGLANYYGADREKIGCVPWGVSHNHFRPIDRREARKRLSIEEAEAVVLFVGRITPIKGLAHLLVAMTRLRPRRRLRLMIVGGEQGLSRQPTETVRLVQRLGLSKGVCFAGRIAHAALPLWYSAADCLVLPSHNETFGLVALEALACGTPVVATRVGAVETFVLDGQTGILVDEPSPVSLARAMEALLTKADGLRLPRAEIARSVSSHTWSAAASHLLDEYNALVAETKDGAPPANGRRAVGSERTLPGGA